MNIDRPVWRLSSVAALGSRYGTRFSAWLDPREKAQAARLRDSGRRFLWRLGRVAAKQLILEHSNCPGLTPRRIRLESRAAGNLGCPPQVTIDEQPLDWSVSISHTNEWIAVAIASDGCRVGIDVVQLEAAEPSLAHWWPEPAAVGDERTGHERASYERTSVARRWALTEAAFKTLGEQTHFRPACFQISTGDASQLSWSYRHQRTDIRGEACWWRWENAVVALAARASASHPFASEVQAA